MAISSTKPVRIPKLSRRPKTNQAYVTWRKKRRYMGVWGKPETEERYRRFVSELVSRPGEAEPTPVTPKTHEVQVVELCAAFWNHAKTWYVKDGKPTGQLPQVKAQIKAIRDFYGSTAVTEFGPSALQSLQRHLVGKGYCRLGVNDQIQGIRRIFKWGVAQEMVPAAIYHALTCVPGLRKGRTRAPDHPPILPVDDATVEATLPYMPVIVADMVRFQRLTGCRPAEVRIVRPCDVDRSGDVWLYIPESHKTEHHGRTRTIFIGPTAQAVLAPYLLRDADAYCFSPIDAEKNRLAERHAKRKTPAGYGNRPGTNRKTVCKKEPGSLYTKDSYSRAVVRAVKKANKQARKEAEESGDEPRLLEPWTPNRLRHTAATEIRRQFGLEGAQVILGHAQANTTEIYAERDAELARSVAAKIG